MTKNCIFKKRGVAGSILAVIFMVLTGITGNNATAQLPAFPGAEGFGKYTSGGRGGMVVAVTNTQDTGIGSFRWAVVQYGTQPLTIVFRVSGIIDLKSALKINRSNITIAGQTAPGDGICFKGNAVEYNGAGAGGDKGNAIIRYLRFRPGAPVFLGATGMNVENTHDVIIDHCDFSWANEENIAIYDTKYTTIQWCISMEGLYSAWHHKGSRSYSGVWGGQYASFHHNLIANNSSRTIRYSGSSDKDTFALNDTRNNVIYNSHNRISCYGGEVLIPGGYSHINIINNTYKPGPSTPANWVFAHATWTVTPAGGTDPNTGIARWHLAGNRMVGNTSFTDSNYNGLDLAEVPVTSRPMQRADTEWAIPAWAQVTMQSADSSYKLVLANAGATLPKRDSADRRIVNETITATAMGTGSYPNGIPANPPYPAYAPSIGNGIIDTVSEVGGWPIYNSTTAPADNDNDGMPDAWETCKGLNPNDSADRNGISGTGYTNLEDYLNGLTCTTGINNASTVTPGLLLYPNPAQNDITVIHPGGSTGATITIISITTGQKLIQYTAKPYTQLSEINISQLPVGGYAVLFQDGGQRLSETFIKK